MITSSGDTGNRSCPRPSAGAAAPSPDAAPGPPSWLGAIGLLGLVAVSLARSFDDFPAADCFSLLVKARELSVAQILSPDQTQVVNPYWRPLFVLFLKATAPLGEASFVAQHLLATAAHALATLTAWMIARRLFGARPGLWLGAALFALNPVTVDTVAWTTVAYAVLSGSFAGVALLAGVSLLARPRVSLWIVLGLALTAAFMASQSGYALAPVLGLYVVLYWRDRRRIISRRRALLLVAGLAGIILAHYFGLETSLSEGQAARMTSRAGGPVARLLVSVPRYPASLLALPAPGPGLFVIVLAAALGLTSWRLGRPGVFLLLASVAATLPYSLVSYNDRYAYFAALFFCPLLGLLLGSFWGPRHAPRPVRLGAYTLLLVLVAFNAWRSQQVLAKWDRLGRVTGQVYDDIGAVVDEVRGAEQLRLVNMPSFFRWLVYDRLRIPSDSMLRWERYLQTDRVRFNPPDIRLGPGEVLLAYENDHLVRKRPEELRGGRIDYPAVGFPRQVVIRTGGEQQILEAVDHCRGDPRQIVVLEEMPPDLDESPAGGELISREIDGRRQEARYRVRMFGRGLAVIVLPYYPRDPLAAAIHQSGRVPDIIAATVDGEAAPTWPAFYHFVAIVVPAGEHTVALRYASRP